jgi:hypothetical protein
MRISVIGSCAFEIDHALQNPCRANGNILAADLALLRADGYCIPWLVHRSFIHIYTYIEVEPVPTIDVLSRLRTILFGRSFRANYVGSMRPFLLNLRQKFLQKWFETSLTEGQKRHHPIHVRSKIF